MAPAEDETWLEDDDNYPIPQLGVIDVLVSTKDGGARMGLVVARPLLADERSQKRLLAKIENYLSELNSAEFVKEFGKSPVENTSITVSIHGQSDALIFDLLERCKDWASDNNAQLIIERQ